MDSERSRLLELMEELAKCKANDAVKLAFLEEGELEEINRLDLTALTGFKRTDKGSIEVQLVDRLTVLKLLVELAGGQEEKAAEFFQAWERKAEEGAQEET
ncbi:XRE family transcriptional regulator [uncultured Flavonifractor sp.]|uniref:XRE family transcriptional regulator n=1 Tax=Candidatus Flavonifractor intestinigallinarum TaxID=2838586 RepID=A0A9D2MM80_9FIRM|nr:XRE family transcriptional regulator [uncultured Flavonifractor sp.]HJB80782.1 XRE family transcriptional regulator [Candidatus Flavonifractor intestinigallinarum]